MMDQVASERRSYLVRARQGQRKVFAPWEKVAEEAIGCHLHLLDSKLPGFCRAYYLVGSLALGDYLDFRSDINFVAIVASKADNESLRKLKEMHTTLSRAFPVTPFDGIYVTKDDLESWPDGENVPWANRRTFGTEKARLANPVTWQTLLKSTRSVREEGALMIHNVVDKTQEWCAENSLWQWEPWREIKDPRGLRGWRLLRSRTLQNEVLGLVRIHATIATGRILSKTEAVAYAKETFGPTWKLFLDDLLLGRTRMGPGPLAWKPFLRRELAAEFMATVLVSLDRTSPSGIRHEAV